MNKMTAVEWLIEQICGDHTEQWQKEIEQAKEIEKVQIIAAYEKGEFNQGCDSEGEQYYNEKFKQVEQ